MNRNIGRLAIVLMLAFAVISIGLGYWQIGRANELLSDTELNRARLYDEEQKSQRGNILDRNGLVLAETKMTTTGGQRVYTNPALVHVIGFHSLKYGNTNVEQSYDEYLRGKAGVNPLTALRNNLLHQPNVGDDVVLTIDSRLQKIADEALGDAQGAIIVTNPRTGEILALASHPYFDPNTLDTQWAQLKDDPHTPLINRATQGLYAPGSTFKTLTAAAVLDSGIANMTQKFDYVLQPGPPTYHTESFNSFSVYCGNHPNSPAGPLSLNITQAYADSCNVTFARLGVALGQQKLTDYASRFGFGNQVPSDLTTAVSQLSATPNFLRDDAALASTGFGQGEILATPLHIALVTNAIANGGVIMEPHVVKEVRNQDGTVLTVAPQQWRQPIGTATAELVKSMMVESVEHGWATGAEINGVTVAGKTGTAEVGEDQGTHAWFTAFAPAYDPIVSVTVMKEHAGGGSAQAIPPAKKVLEAALALLR